ncbi:MAG TPA: tetratricopeptide repeat protein, partial [Vicinamibacterales bacterium]|nr:tetratricopeptide repeat protein [Vicinamibacterales bacterium]
MQLGPSSSDHHADTTRTCPVCGAPQPGDRCARCEPEPPGLQWRLRVVHRETVQLAVLVVIAGVAFALTQTVAQSNRELRLRDAGRWYDRAARELQAGRPAGATAALRRAVATNPENHQYQLELARALADSGQDAQALQVLLRLRDRHPEDADVNLELARLESRAGDQAAAVRYYEHTLAALWSDSVLDSRQRVRMELVEFLLRHRQRGRALAELLVLSPTLPDDANTRTKTGRLFLEAGDPRRALEQFLAALGADPGDGAALAGAGEAAFEQGNYARAREYFARVPEPDDRIVALRTIADLVLARDPLAPRLG